MQRPGSEERDDMDGKTGVAMPIVSPPKWTPLDGPLYEFITSDASYWDQFRGLVPSII